MQKVSKRAEKLINTPLYSVKKEELDEAQDKMFVFKKDGIEFYINVELNDLNKLSNLKYSSNIIGVDVAIVESCFKMLENRSIDRLYSMNFREAESYLRDENHVESFPEGTEADWIFEMLKKTAHFLLKSSLKTIECDELMPHASLVQKIKYLNNLLEMVSFDSFIIGQFVKVSLVQLELKRLEVAISPKKTAIVQLFEKDILENLSSYISSLLGEEICTMKYEQ